MAESDTESDTESDAGGGPRAERDVRAQLADIDDQLARLRGDSRDLSAQVGGRADGPQDAEDIAAALTNAEETGALIDVLQARRDRLADELAAGE